MSRHDNQRIITLQKALKAAKTALQKIAHNDRAAYAVAELALEEIQRLELQGKPTPLQSA